MSVQHPLPAASSAADQPVQPSFVSLRLWLADSPWRLSGGWLLLAGLLASTGLQALHRPLLPLLLALVLTEVLWGALWSQWVPARAWPGRQALRRPSLPYVQPGSPAARLLGWPEPGPAAAMVRAGLPLVFLATLLALSVGQPAPVLTGLVVGAVLLGMAAQQAGLTGLAAWLQALVQATLPFTLGVALAGAWPAAPHDVWIVALGAGYTLLARALIPGEMPAHQADPSRAARSAPRLLLAAAGTVLIVAVLLLNQQPLAAGLASLLAVAPLLMWARAAAADPLRQAQPWLWALLLGSALALGTGIG